MNLLLTVDTSKLKGQQFYQTSIKFGFIAIIIILKCPISVTRCSYFNLTNSNHKRLWLSLIASGSVMDCYTRYILKEGNFVLSESLWLLVAHLLKEKTQVCSLSNYDWCIFLKFDQTLYSLFKWVELSSVKFMVSASLVWFYPKKI